MTTTLPALHVVGDSISIQYGPALAGFLAGRFAYSRKEGSPGNLDVAAGANGGDSGMVLRYLAHCAEQRARWDLLLVNCGLHDMKTDPATGSRQVAPPAYEANLEAIIAMSKTLADELVWIRTTPVVTSVHNRPGMTFHRFAEDVEAYNAIADRVMSARGIASIDLCGFTRGFGEAAYADHVHYTEPVRTAQAAFIAGWLAGHPAGA